MLREILSNLSDSTAGILLRRTFGGWAQDDAPRLGAALAFYSILSLAPLLLLFLTLATFLWGREAAEGDIAHQISRFFGTHAADAIQSVLTTSAKSGNAGFIATIVGIGTLLFSASGMFGELQSAMNIIWKVKPREKRPWLILVREKGFSFLMVLGSGVFFAASLLLSAGVAAVTHFVSDLLPWMHVVLQFGDFLLSFGIMTLLFALIFRVVPDATIPWRSVWVGGALTAALFVAGKMLIGFYLGRVGITSTYGAAGSLVALLIWIYYSAQILFLGAEFTYAYSFHYGLYDTKPT